MGDLEKERLILENMRNNTVSDLRCFSIRCYFSMDMIHVKKIVINPSKRAVKMMNV
jgi:hypothetical protein